MFILGLLILLFGALAPPLLFPHQNQILTGFIGAPFVLIGFIIMLAASVPTRRLGDKDAERKERRDDP